MKKKLIFINFLKFFENDKKRLELNKLNKKFDLELHEFYRIQSNTSFKKSTFKKENYNLKSFESIEVWKSLILNYKNKGYFDNNKISVIFISQFFFKSNFLEILNFLKRNDIKIASFLNPGILKYENKLKFKKNFFFFKAKILSFFNKYKQSIRFVFWVSYLKKIQKKKNLDFDYIFVAGKKYNQKFYENYSKKQTKIIHFNSFDYSTYLNSKPQKFNYKYAVFLAEPGPGNFSDSSFLKLGGVVEKMKIYKDLCEFFKLIEMKLKIKVLICSHPKSTNDKKLYKGFEIFRGHTSEIVSNCEFVMHKQSTAMSYAVLNYKPIIFLMNNDFMLKDHGQYKYSLYLAKYFKTSLLNINNNIDFKKFKKNLRVRPNLYNKFIKDYLSSKRNKKNYQIISENI